MLKHFFIELDYLGGKPQDIQAFNGVNNLKKF